jgi:hypothetical protein
MVTKEFCIQKYKEFKEKFRKIPKNREYCRFAGISARIFQEIFGRNAYSKLQIEAGDDPNKISMDRTPLEKIMRQYGDLTIKLKELPFSSDWIHHKLKPTPDGLKKIHRIAWLNFPQKFKEWIEEEDVTGYEEVLDIINQKSNIAKFYTKNGHPEYHKLISDIRQWAPARGRNSEEAYKLELRLALQKMGYDVGEERGDSNVDLLVNRKYAVEIKKSPIQSDYDRLFGQLARHLQQQKNVVALIMDVSRGDNYNDFCSLVDAFLNQGEHFIEVIKK